MLMILIIMITIYDGINCILVANSPLTDDKMKGLAFLQLQVG